VDRPSILSFEDIFVKKEDFVLSF